MPVDQEIEDKSDDDQSTLSTDNNSDFGSSSSEEAEEAEEMEVDNLDQENIKKTHKFLYTLDRNEFGGVMLSMTKMCNNREINNEEDQEAVDTMRKTLEAIWPNIEDEEEDTEDGALICIRMTPASYQDYIAYRDIIRSQPRPAVTMYQNETILERWAEWEGKKALRNFNGFRNLWYLLLKNSRRKGARESKVVLRLEQEEADPDKDGQNLPAMAMPGPSRMVGMADPYDMMM